MKLRKILKSSLKGLPFLLVAAVFLSVIFFPHTEVKAEPSEKRVVKIWNVDTFEGGKGSRTAFLRRVALQAEKENDGVFYFITSYTLEGANAAYEAGNRPDILSFGIGLSVYAEKSLPLPYTFAGGNTKEGCLAYPWCGGEYYLFSLTDDFEAEGATALSKGGNNLPEVAANLAGIKGETVESTAAYVGFLSGKYRYLLGTQRDVCRFASRGINVYNKPLPNYCDLYQYISVLSAEKRTDCDLFVSTLLSAKIQDQLSDIGMFTVREISGNKTLSAFTDAEALKTLSQTAASGTDGKNLDKFLKTV